MTDPDRRERFTALYDTYHSRVYAYVVSRAGRQAADEVVSETFLVAWRRFDDMPRPELHWLFGVARNILHVQRRTDARRASLEEELRASLGETSTRDVADDVANRAQMLAALSALPADDREILTLVAWHGLSAAEAAAVVGCSTATYSVRLHRARRRLERALEPRPEKAVRPAEFTPRKESGQ
jgi:RNA polymerase sigma-70 factor (ECF subfamily)